jgi:glycosyltransferase 2 family protein
MSRSWRGALGFALSAALLYWTLRGERWGDIRDTLLASDLLLWGLATIVSQLIFPLRALRWRVILHPAAPDVALGALWRSTAIGMMVNNVLPARAGELARAYAIGREDARVPFTTALGSLAVDRTFDAATVVLLLVLATLDPAFGTATSLGAGTTDALVVTGLALVAGAFAVLMLGAWAPARIEAMATALVGALRPAWAPRVAALVRAFTSGLGVLRDPRRFGLVFLWTLAHWLTNAAAFWLAFKALALDLPFSAALLVQGVIAMGVSIPSSPGFFGVFEAAGKASLVLYGVAETDAVSWALGFHILSFIPITLIGAWYFIRLGLSMGDVRAAGVEGRRDGPAAP